MLSKPTMCRVEPIEHTLCRVGIGPDYHHFADPALSKLPADVISHLKTHSQPNRRMVVSKTTRKTFSVAKQTEWINTAADSSWSVLERPPMSMLIASSPGQHSGLLVANYIATRAVISITNPDDRLKVGVIPLWATITPEYLNLFQFIVLHTFDTVNPSQQQLDVVRMAFDTLKNKQLIVVAVAKSPELVVPILQREFDAYICTQNFVAV